MRGPVYGARKQVRERTPLRPVRRLCGAPIQPRRTPSITFADACGTSGHGCLVAAPTWVVDTGDGRTPPRAVWGRWWLYLCSQVGSKRAHEVATRWFSECPVTKEIRH